MVTKDEKIEEVPKLSGKDMNALMYLLIKSVGTVEIPQEVFDTAPRAGEFENRNAVGWSE